MDEKIGTAAEILLVEGNPACVRLTVEAPRDVNDRNHVIVGTNGLEAMNLLRGRSPNNKASHFDVILPKKNCRELLAELKNNTGLKQTPVILLTNSKAEADIRRTYDVHANCDITKPDNMNGTPSQNLKKNARKVAQKAPWNLRLNMAGETPRCLTALANLKQMWEQHLPGVCHIEVIVLLENPKLSQGDRILAIPTLVRGFPAPVRKFIGDLSNTERVRVDLDLRPCA